MIRTQSAKSTRRNHFLRIIAVSFIFIQTFLPLTQAATTVTGTLTANTTWTLANSPYIVTGTVTVPSSLSLTIEPGVIVKFQSQTSGITVNGILNAIGTANNQIFFTSIKDDLIGGDTGNDGPTVGTPGSWYQVRCNGSQSILSYVVFRFGGWGSADNNYGALVINTLPSAVCTIDHAIFFNNQRSGVFINAGNPVISNSEFSSNANGISVANAGLTASYLSIHDNTSFGLFLNQTVYTGTPVSITRSNIKHNVKNGIRLQVASSTPLASLPFGHENNIQYNDYLSTTSPVQLYSIYNLKDSDWSNNYWSLNYVDGTTEIACLQAPAGWHPAHIAYVPFLSGKVPPGPINFATFWDSITGLFYGADYVKSTPISTVPF